MVTSFIRLRPSTIFFKAVSIFQEQFDLDVFMEPGAATVRRSGTIEATVHDLFESDETQIAVLDTSVNHMSEIFEFQFEPDVLGDIDGGLHTYTLAGCTCLAGDVFGEYAFDRVLDIGSRVTFPQYGRLYDVEGAPVQRRRATNDLSPP